MIVLPNMACRLAELSADLPLRAYVVALSVYTDRGYQMVIFSTVIAGLAEQVDFMMRNLGFGPRLYRVPQQAAKTSFKYQVRLSRGVPDFLQLVQPLKQ